MPIATVPFATTPVGFVAFAVALCVFVGQEFSQGFGTPTGARIRDDRWSLVYLEVLPVLLVTASIVASFIGYGAWPASRETFVVGIIALVAGIAFRQWSHRTLGRFHQAVVTIHPDHQLITSGPHRYVRHPMYAGSVMAFLGIGLALGTWPSLLLSFMGTLPAILRRIRVEERMMAESLGHRYDTYAKGRSRLVPHVW